MTTFDRLEELEKTIGQTSDPDVLRLLGKEVIRLARAEMKDNGITQDYQLQLLHEARQREHRLKELLREALRAWVVHTPDLREAVHVFQIARQAGI